jgi:hypothetical protein
VAMYVGEYCILREETVRERRGSYNGFCCRLYPFILLDNNKERTWKFLWWTKPTLGEPRKSVSLLYCVSSVFCFHICFILLLHGPVFLTTLSS